MPPSSFASAAASTNPSAPSPRDGGPEWARRTNGATQTFRRPSGASSMAGPNQQPPDGSTPAQPPPRYVPPHRNGTHTDSRYSKDQLLDAFRAQQSAEGGLRDGLPGLYIGGWQPDTANGAVSAGWGRTDHGRDVQPGPDVCWDREGRVEPLGLTDMDEEERELFATSVNTPLKPPSAVNKDVQAANGMSTRKPSISTNAATPGGYGLPSPSLARGAGRRRDTSESYPFPLNTASPSVNRDDQRAPSPPPALLRRRTDLKDVGKLDEDDEKHASTPFGTLKRTQTGPLSAGLGAPSSPWSATPQSAGFPPMGSFGNFGLGSGQQSTPGEKRPGVSSGRAESRFKNLLSKDSNEDIAASPSVQRKGSMSSLSRLNENEPWRPQDALRETEEDSSGPSGSAALAGESASMTPGPQSRQQGSRGGAFGTPSRPATHDEFNSFGAFGMTPDNAHGFGGQGFLQGRDASQQTPAAQRTGQQPLGNGHEPMSPTDTNPYQSPDQHGIDRLIAEDSENEGSDVPNAHLPGLGGLAGHDQVHPLGGLGGLSALPNFARAPGPASDRSQTSSVGANRGFSTLGGFGQLGGGSAGWPVTQPGFGTPGRQASGLASAFGGGIFATSMGELQSPGLAGLGGAGLMSPAQSAAGFGGGGRMASMFPSAMQDQMRDHGTGGERNVPSGFGGLGSGAGSQMQLPLDLSSDPQHSHDDQSQQPPSSDSSQPPAPQQRTMVMPDRMRWIYRDPQGQTQGPWSGLEMHDWYKAGFFSPELLVKKYEDPDYEPLAQLIRRIGNSREPFLVPQIGIPHGAMQPAAAGGGGAAANPWASGVGNGGNGVGSAALGAGGGIAGIGGAGGPTSSGGAQPPFASSFPSFGTTLTADQQNALERRKQEEQYLMARQKEHLAQAQIAQRITSHHNVGGVLQQHGGLGGLHHQGSVQSLHSQSSFGNIASPSAAAFQPSPSQGPAGAAGFFDNSFRAPQGGGLGAVGAGVDSLGHIREEEIPGIMDRLNLGRGGQGGQYGAPGGGYGGQQQHQQQQGANHEQIVQQMKWDRANLKAEQERHDRAVQQQQQQGGEEQQSMGNERLQQFQQLQGQALGAGLDARFQPAISKPTATPVEEEQASTDQSSIGSPVVTQAPSALPHHRPEHLSLTEQVEKAVSAQQSPAPQQTGLPMPFPPPEPSRSPLPAPAAQRTGRQSVADQLQTESRELSQTPSSVEAAAGGSRATAPWAKEHTESKGPSLKQIQAVEQKMAVEAEALAAAARRAAFERELEVQSAAAAAAASVQLSGLPTGASWASAGGGNSPATPTTGGGIPAAWNARLAPQKVAGKTLAQIQREEEQRKKRVGTAQAQALATQVAVAGGPAAAAGSGGKSYASLAGKVGVVAGAGAGASAWTTVGASGKVRTPAPAPVVAAAAAAVAPVLLLGRLPGVAAAGVGAPAPAPVAVVQSVVRRAPSQVSVLSAGVVNAQEAFRKWAVGELRPALNKGINVDEFFSIIVALDADGVTETVHGASMTIDSRHFAEEFFRRKRLAEKGQVDLSGGGGKSGSPAGMLAGGWSEVAKKVARPEVVREESQGAFRVVAGKKKGGKR
ncbi:hypothetical protein LTR08_004949 [Meristemomyces frigidus]|nr:hypothetical protein LTR08_004949 [Meristemomyces frigidus]